MRRLALWVPLAVVFAAGFALGASRMSTAEARPRPTCKDDLGRVQRELTSARAELRATRGELEQLVRRERQRVEQLERALGGAVAGDGASDLGAPIQQLR